MKNRLLASMPTMTPGRLSRVNTLNALPRPEVRAAACMDGSAFHCQASATRAIGTRQRKAPRQPMKVPSQAPSGAATTVASALPPLTRASARGTSRLGTRRMAVAADIDQKPPITTPIRARPIM
ncbi:hypothetical protein D9M68_684360 [compost metagenome]